MLSLQNRPTGLIEEYNPSYVFRNPLKSGTKVADWLIVSRQVQDHLAANISGSANDEGIGWPIGKRDGVN
jgi:hypothetical protein